MKYPISIAIAVAVFFAVGFSVTHHTEMGEAAVLSSAVIAGAIAFMVSLSKLQWLKSGTSITSDVIGTVKNFKENVESDLDTKQADLYAKAEEEYDNGEIDKGLWSQALVKANGDEKLRKVEYMKLRVKQLKK